MATTRSGRSRALRNVMLCWFVFTVLTAPFAYGVALVLTVPVLACLVITYWIQPRGLDILYLVITALALTVCVAWFLGRADERPLEGVAAAFFIVCGVVELFVLRSGRAERMNRR
jgi:hypothetical protein